MPLHTDRRNEIRCECVGDTEKLQGRQSWSSYVVRRRMPIISALNVLKWKDPKSEDCLGELPNTALAMWWNCLKIKTKQKVRFLYLCLPCFVPRIRIIIQGGTVNILTGSSECWIGYLTPMEKFRKKKKRGELPVVKFIKSVIWIWVSACLGRKHLKCG